MSLITSVQSSSCVQVRERYDVFQDLPIIDKSVRLTVIEQRHSDMQVVNELVYRWCRIITRVGKKPLDKIQMPTDTSVQDLRRVLLIDLTGSINPVRLATVMKRDERRMRMIGIVRGCKINSTYVTLSAHLSGQNSSTSMKLIVIYQDEFYILKTLALLKESVQNSGCQILLVVPRLDRQEQDVLSLTSNYQVLKCDFCVNRREIAPAPLDAINDAYQSYLNQIYFQRCKPNKALPDKVLAELTEDGLHLTNSKVPIKVKCNPALDANPLKRLKSGEHIKLEK